jgi:hypothetical protein
MENDETIPQKYEAALKTLLDGLKDIKNTAEEASELAETWCRRFKNGQFEPGDEEKVLNKLDKANSTITASAVKEVAGFLFPDMAELGKSLKTEVSRDIDLQETSQVRLLWHLEYSQCFYQALAETVKYNLNLLLKPLK